MRETLKKSNKHLLCPNTQSDCSPTFAKKKQAARMPPKETINKEEIPPEGTIQYKKAGYYPAK